MSAQGQPSWRDHFDIHPAAAFYHGFSSDEQLKELTEDIGQRQVIFDPIHTASVFGKTFVIDGVSRLDAAEKTGRQIIDEKGNWIGVLDRHVVHHSGKTDEEVWDIVSSLNLKRRHLSKEQILEVADHMLKLEAAEKGAAKKERASSARSFSPNPGKRGGSTKDPHKTALHERAEKIAGGPISNRTVEKYLSRQPDCPKKAPVKTKAKKERPFNDQVWDKWQHFLNHHWSPAERHEVKPILHGLTALMLKYWPSGDYAIVTFMRFMDLVERKNCRTEEQCKEALTLIHGWADPKSKERS
jgi:hypothetical protein